MTQQSETPKRRRGRPRKTDSSAQDAGQDAGKQHEHEFVEVPSDAERGPLAGYTGGRYAPITGYATLIAIFNALLAAFLLATRGGRRGMPERIGAGDILLAGIATHKLSRLVSKDFVTSPLRAPFTKALSNAGTGEMNEEARGRGLRQAVGELVTCPWCVDWWIAAFFGYGLVLAPRLTRWIGAVFSAVAVADFLQLAYEKAKSASGQAPS